MSIDMYIGSVFGITQHAPRHFGFEKTLYHDSLMQPLCVSATHIYLQPCKLEFDEQMLACTVAEISVAQALLMKAFFKRKKSF